MQKWIQGSAWVVLLVALGLLAFAQWLPALMFLPVGAAMLLWNGRSFSVPFYADLNQTKRDDHRP